MKWKPDTDELHATYLIAKGASAADALKMFGVQGLQGFITAGKGNELTVSELKMILKEKKLPTSGTKALLIQRLMDVE